MKPKDIPLDKIKLVEGVQQRTKLDESHVAELADAITDGATLPPARVWFDGTDYILSRGFHRLPAYRRLQFAAMPCEVRDGGVREAILDACCDNADHGLKRTNADKRKAVATLLADKEWGKKSDRWIADAVKVGPPLVASIRSTVISCSSTTREGRDGKIRNMPAKGIAGAAVDPADGPQWVETDQDKKPVLSDSDWSEADAEKDRDGKAKSYLKAAEKSLGALQDNCTNAARQGAKFDLSIVEKSARAIYSVIEQGRKSL